MSSVQEEKVSQRWMRSSCQCISFQTDNSEDLPDAAPAVALSSSSLEKAAQDGLCSLGSSEPRSGRDYFRMYFDDGCESIDPEDEEGVGSQPESPEHSERATSSSGEHSRFANCHSLEQNQTTAKMVLWRSILQNKRRAAGANASWKNRVRHLNSGT